MAETAIEWTDVVWNPTTGCDKVSPGCDNCYALTMAKRLKGMGSAKYQTDGDPRTSGPGFGLATHEDVLRAPLRWRRPRRVFVNSMSDLFHPRVTDEFIARVFAVMARTPQHTYQILTKRAPRMASLIGGADGSGHRLREAAKDEETARALYDTIWPLSNVCLGVSVEDQQRADERIPHLIRTPAAVRWVSAEPLLGPLDLAGGGTQQTYWLTGRPYWGEPEPIGNGPILGRSPLVGPRLDWVVVGGETARGQQRARPMHPAWARSLRDQCAAAGVGLFFKQWGDWVEPDQIDTAGWDDVAWNENGLTMWPDGRTQAGPAGTCVDGSAMLWRVGKRRAGHRLDGVEYLESPRLVNR